RGTVLAIEPVVAALGGAADADPVTTRVLDATADLLGELGLGRWSVEDVAERSGIGRTTVDRRFAGRARLVHAVLAGGSRAFPTAIGVPVAHVPRLEDQVVAGMLVGMRAFRTSGVAQLLERGPQAVLPLLTTGATELLAAA